MTTIKTAQTAVETRKAESKSTEVRAALERCLSALEICEPHKQESLLAEIKAVARLAGDHMVDLERRMDSLESLVGTDELTGVLNRRSFTEQLDRVLAMAARYGGRGVLAYIDLDDFKVINDRFGHLAGDAVLKRVAEILEANTRTGDIVARIGGDEFVVLLVNSGWRWGKARARQLQRMVNRSFARCDDYRIPLRVSLGLTTYRPGDAASELVGRADEAMYEDKRERATLVHIATAKIARDQKALANREAAASP